MSRLALQASARAGTMTLLSGYCASVGLGMQRYRARPALLKPPAAWVEDIGETLEPVNVEERMRRVRVAVKVVWGQYDSGAAIDQRDAFVDGFLDWCAENPHAFGANTVMDATAVSDDPAYTPPWNTADENTYFSTELVLEGFAST